MGEIDGFYLLLAAAAERAYADQRRGHLATCPVRHDIDGPHVLASCAGDYLDWIRTLPARNALPAVAIRMFSHAA